MRRILASLLCLPAVASAGWQAVGDVTAVDREPNGVVLHTAQGLVAVIALSPEIVRIRYTPAGHFGRDHSWAVVQRDFGNAKVDIHSDEKQIELVTSSLRVHIERAPLRIETFDVEGRSLDADDAEQGLSHAGASVRVAKRLRDDEHVYGLGEKTGRLDKRGWSLGGYHYTMWNTDTFAYDPSTDPLYVSVPFYLVLRDGRAHGVFLDNAYRSSFDIGKDAQGLLAFGAAGGDLDYYLIAGPEPKAVIERYTALTGRTPLPPRWSLGYQQCRWSYYPESRVRLLADTFRSKQVPADGLWLDIDYQQDFKPFTWNHERFADPKKMIGDLGKQGFHVVTILDAHPTQEPGYRVYDEGVAGDHFVKAADGKVFTGPVWPSQAKQHGGDSAFPDFTRAPTRAWWGRQSKSLLDVGVAGIWNDMNEPAVWIKPTGTMPPDVRHDNDGEPTDHAAVHNVYGMQHTRSTFEGLAALQPDTRPFVLTRSSFAGGQRYAAVWSGDNTSDWMSLRQSLPTLMGLGISGFAFVGADVGGFAGTPSGELFSRWLQAAAFSPFFRAHTEAGTPDQEPWSYGANYEAINRRTIELRYRLLPTLYTVMEEASRTGVPALRALFLEFPDDPNSASRDDEYLLGADVLMAPVLYEGAVEREVYLPPGDWFAYESGVKVAGSRGFKIPVTAESLPMYVRGGAFLFSQPVVQNTGEMSGKTLTVQVYPATKSSGQFYEDDGASLAYRKGAFARRHFSQQRDGDTIRIEVTATEGKYRPATRSLIFALFGRDEAQRVEVGGSAIARIDDTVFDQAETGWTVRAGTLQLKLRDRPEALHLTVIGSKKESP
jgi:alpha-glucosidase